MRTSRIVICKCPSASLSVSGKIGSLVCIISSSPCWMNLAAHVLRKFDIIAVCRPYDAWFWPPWQAWLNRLRSWKWHTWDHKTGEWHQNSAVWELGITNVRVLQFWHRLLMCIWVWPFPPALGITTCHIYIYLWHQYIYWWLASVRNLQSTSLGTWASQSVCLDILQEATAPVFV